MSFGAEMRAGLDMHFTFSSNYFALDTIQNFIKVFYIREPGTGLKYNLFGKKSHGWVGLSSPKLLVKFLNHYFYGIFDNYIGLKVQFL